MAPMTGESRAIVRLGLEELARTQHAGPRALLARSCDAPEQPTARDLAFGVVPRINAAGRIADAELAIAPARGGSRASGGACERARGGPRAAPRHDEDRDRRRSSMVGGSGTAGRSCRDDGWAPGLVGLVAGRTGDALARPVVARPSSATRSGLGAGARGLPRRGRPREVRGASDEARRPCRSRRLQPAPRRLAGLRRSVRRRSTPVPRRPPPRPRVRAAVVVDLVLPARHLDWRLADQLERLAPYGPGHLEPVLAVTGMVLADARRVGPREQHVAFRMRRGIETFDAVAFGIEAERPLPEERATRSTSSGRSSATTSGMPRLRLRVVDFADATGEPARRAAARPQARLAARMTGPALERLRERRAVVGAPLCVGIDPHPDALPDGLPRDVRRHRGLRPRPHRGGGRRRGRGEDQRRLLRGVRGRRAGRRSSASDGPCRLSVICILDAKRGDIGSTAERYAAGLFGHLEADAVTVSPYLGEDAIEPFLAVPDRLVYLLARTSNPSAPRLQALVARRRADPPPRGALGRRHVAGRPRRASSSARPRRTSLRQCVRRCRGRDSSCPVSGRRAAISRLRCAHADGAWAPGVVTVSRGIARASRGSDWREPPLPRQRHAQVRMADAVLHSMASPVQRQRSEVHDSCRFPDRWSSSCCW